MRDRTSSNPPSTQLSRAAQYLRMSTEHQRYSIANQSAAIALYAAAHKIGIVRSFVDSGKSGRTIKNRYALQELLRVVESGAADFDQILVYDISRWGRFPDSDEAAHYEFLCKRAGIPVRYCAEQFENDNSTISNLLRALKRTMAGEYSRELAVKVSAGQQRLARMGFWQGGSAPFGFVRQVVNIDGKPKQILKSGQSKSIARDRVVLIPGPAEALETIHLAFDLYTERGKSRHEIARRLNEEKRFLKRHPWNLVMLHDLFTNPIYKGIYIYPYSRRDEHKQSAEACTVREHSLPEIIPESQWNRARDMVLAETRTLDDSEMLDALRSLWKREGKLNSVLVNRARDIPSTTAYQHHFGSLSEAYKLIDYPFPRDFSYMSSISKTRRLRETLCDELCARIRDIGGEAERGHGYGIVVVNGNIRLRITFSTGSRWHGPDHPEWRLALGTHSATDVTIIARLRQQSHSIMDYFVVPALAQFRGILRVQMAHVSPVLQPYCFENLDSLIESLGRHYISGRS